MKIPLARFGGGEGRGKWQKVLMSSMAARFLRPKLSCKTYCRGKLDFGCFKEATSHR